MKKSRNSDDINDRHRRRSLSSGPINNNNDLIEGIPLLPSNSSSSSSSSVSPQPTTKGNIRASDEKLSPRSKPSTHSYSTFDVLGPEENDKYKTMPSFHGSLKYHSSVYARRVIYDNNRKQVRAIFAYRAKNPKEISLEVGDIITVTNNADLDWWEGILPNGKRGWFPSNYCTRFDPLETHQQSVEEGLQEIEQILPSKQVSGGNENDKKDEENDSFRSIDIGKEEDESFVPLTLWEKVWSKLSEYVFCRMLLYFLLCGILTSLVSVTIDYASHYTYSLRSLPFSRIDSKFFRFLYWFTFSAILTSTGHALTKFISPFSAGSGIPEVKVIMSGVELPQYLSLRVLIGKVVGLTLSLSAGLFAGKQGPMVHIGAVIATLLTYLPPFRCKVIMQIIDM